MNENKVWYSPSEAGTYLGKSDQWIRNLIKSGDLKARKDSLTGNKTYYKIHISELKFYETMMLCRNPDDYYDMTSQLVVDKMGKKQWQGLYNLIGDLIRMRQ